MADIIAKVEVPWHYPTSMFYVDDSGVKAAEHRILVMGGIKVRRHGALLRSIRHVREQCGFTREFKFSGINKGSLSAYYAMIEHLAESDAHLVACVTQQPPKDQGGWRFYAEATTRLIHGNINRRELVGVLMDEVSTPRDIGFEDFVRGMVNKRIRATSVVTAACLDSRASDGLQVADLVAGAVAFERRRIAGESGKPNSMKGRVVARLKEAFGVAELTDHRCERVNIQSWEPRAPKLQIVKASNA